MRYRLTRVVAVLLVVVLSGCVEVYQLVRMNRDGSGTLTERIRILPRTVRLMAGRKARTGESEDQFKLLTDQAVERQVKAFGGVTLKSKKQTPLPDGAVELEALFDFKDINKVTFWMVPTFACTDKNRKGELRLPYARVVGNKGMDLINVNAGRPPSQQKFSSPSVLQDYRRVAPIFQDMLSDFRFEIQVQAPSDLEQFEDHSMVRGMPFEGNTVTVYRVYGENVVLNQELIRGFLMGEIAGRVDSDGGEWRKMERGLPNTMTPYGCDYYGMAMRFLKTVVDVPTTGPATKPEK